MTTDVNPDEFLENVHLQGFIKRLDQFEESMRSLVEGLKEHDTKLNDLESKIDASIEEFKEDLLINELNDFQVKLDRLENQLLDTRRHTATGAMTEHANSAFNFLSRMRDFEPTHASEAQDCLGYLSRRYIRAKSEARHSDNPEEEERKYREDVKAYLARFDFKPFFEE